MPSAERYTVVNGSRGATFVEFAIAAVLMFGVIGIFFEGGVAYFRYSVLVSSLTQSARELALNMSLSKCTTPAEQSLLQNGGTLPAGSVMKGAQDVVKTFVQNSFGQDASEITVDANVVPTPSVGASPASGRCTLKLKGHWPTHCFFCIFSQNGVTIGAEGESLVEDQCFACNGATC